MEEKIVLTGIARSKGRAAGEALVNHQRMGWSLDHVGNEDGNVLVPGADIQGKCVIGKVVVYPVMGSTNGAISLSYKCPQSHHRPAAIICRKVLDIHISGAIAGEIPAIDDLDQDPITTIRTGDWVEIDAPNVGQNATVTITRKAQEPQALTIVKAEPESTDEAVVGKLWLGFTETTYLELHKRDLQRVQLVANDNSCAYAALGAHV